MYCNFFRLINLEFCYDVLIVFLLKQQLNYDVNLVLVPFCIEKYSSFVNASFDGHHFGLPKEFFRGEYSPVPELYFLPAPYRG